MCSFNAYISKIKSINSKTQVSLEKYKEKEEERDQSKLKFIERNNFKNEQ
jgi:hypothetical protein